MRGKMEKRGNRGKWGGKLVGDLRDCRGKFLGGRIWHGGRNGGPTGHFEAAKCPKGRKRAQTRKNKNDTPGRPLANYTLLGAGDPPTDGREIPQNVKSENENKLHREIYLVEAYLVARPAPPLHTAPPASPPAPSPKRRRVDLWSEK